MVRAHVYVSGKVQGVFFRESTVKEASSRGVAGWVRNLGDGRVEAVFEGPRPAVEQCIAWCATGPAMAQVADLEVIWDESEEGLVGFERRTTFR